MQKEQPAAVGLVPYIDFLPCRTQWQQHKEIQGSTTAQRLNIGKSS